MTKKELAEYNRLCDWYRDVNLSGSAGCSAMCYYCKSGLSFSQPYVSLHDRIRLHGKTAEDTASIYFHTSCFIEIAGTEYVLERK